VSFLWHHFLGTFYDGLVVGILFIVTAIMSRWLAIKKPEQWIGIIDFVWLLILGFTFGGIVFSSNFDVIQVDTIPIGLNAGYYSQYASELSFLLGKSIDLLIILGSILAICMSIIWSGEIWRKKDEKGQEQYYSTTRAAISMTFAYFVVFITVVV